MEKLLSIAIPTYNRCDCLREELENIIPQLLPYKEEVEIVISDNASPESDGTSCMVVELEKKYGISIDYKKLSSPIYFEDNFNEAVSRSHGRYVHMSGDDDLYSPNFYDVVFHLIKEDYGLIHFNRLEGDIKCTNTRVYDTHYNSMTYSTSTEEMVKYVMRSAGFMSSLIFRRDCWDEGEKFEKENYYGYHFLGRLYQGAMSVGAKSCYYYMPMLIARNNSHAWGKMFPLYYFCGYSNIFRDTDRFAPGIFDKWLDILHNQNKRTNMLIIGSILQDRPFYESKKEEMLCYMSKEQASAFKFLLSSKLPLAVLQKIYNLYLRMKY